jgi:hypothetical protein
MVQAARHVLPTRKFPSQGAAPPAIPSWQFAENHEQMGHPPPQRQIIMADQPNRWKYAASRGELKIWLVLSTLGLALVGAILVKRGLPSGPAFFEVVLLPTVFLGWVFARSVKRLLRHEHPD